MGRSPLAKHVTDKDAVLLESMLKFYDQFAQQNQADVKLQKETARAHRRVGDIRSGWASTTGPRPPTAVP